MAAGRPAANAASATTATITAVIDPAGDVGRVAPLGWPSLAVLPVLHPRTGRRRTARLRARSAPRLRRRAVGRAGWRGRRGVPRRSLGPCAPRRATPAHAASARPTRRRRRARRRGRVVLAELPEVLFGPVGVTDPEAGAAGERRPGVEVVAGVTSAERRAAPHRWAARSSAGAGTSPPGGRARSRAAVGRSRPGVAVVGQREAPGGCRRVGRVGPAPGAGATPRARGTHLARPALRRGASPGPSRRCAVVVAPVRHATPLTSATSVSAATDPRTFRVDPGAGTGQPRPSKTHGLACRHRRR